VKASDQSRPVARGEDIERTPFVTLENHRNKLVRLVRKELLGLSRPRSPRELAVFGIGYDGSHRLMHKGIEFGGVVEILGRVLLHVVFAVAKDDVREFLVKQGLSSS
jgi:hypothetical protein